MTVKNLIKRFSGNKAFTSIELLLATVILSMLSSVAIPFYQTARERAYDHEALQAIFHGHQLSKDVFISNGETYPVTDQLILGLSQNEPGTYSYRAAQADVSVATGPHDLSYQVDDQDTVTICSKSVSGRAFCVRFVDGRTQLATGGYGVSTGQQAVALGAGPLGEVDARAALPTVDSPPTADAGPTNTGEPVLSTHPSGKPASLTDPTLILPDVHAAPATPVSAPEVPVTPVPDPAPTTTTTTTTPDPAPTTTTTTTTTTPDPTATTPAAVVSAPPVNPVPSPPANPAQPAEGQVGAGSNPSTPCPGGNASIISSHLDVLQGGTATATFSVGAGCQNIQVTLASYKTNAATFTLPQTLIDSKTSTFNAGGTYSLQVNVDPCFYQVDFVMGGVITNLASDNLYGNRKLQWVNGGSACAPAKKLPVPPSLVFQVGPPKVTANQSALISWTNNGGPSVSQTCNLDGVAYNCPLTNVSLSNLNYGSHTFQIFSSNAGGQDSIAYTWSVTTPPDDRLILKNNGDYATAAGTFLPTKAFEVGAWVRLYSAPNGQPATIASEGCTWSNGAGCASNAGWSLGVNKGMTLDFTVNTSSKGWIDQTYGKTSNCPINPSAKMDVGRWHYVSAAFDPAGYITTWIDGKLAACSGKLGGLTPSIASGNPLMFGAQPNPAGNLPAAAFCNCVIGEFRATTGGSYANVSNPGPSAGPGLLASPAENGRAANIMFHWSDWSDSMRNFANAQAFGGAHLASQD